MSTYDVSQTLINKLQILLRNEAGLPSSFAASDHPPPSISAAGSISGDNVLRCDSCAGELLRGLDSVICVFCGRFLDELRNSPRKPVDFTATLGYQWFLQSLSLDGSETVEREIEGGNEFGRGQSSVKNEIPLSALLDLQLKWPDEPNRPGVDDEPGKRSVKLVGLDLDELSSRDGGREGASSHSNGEGSTFGGQSSERVTKIEEGTTFAAHSSLSLFENTQTGFSEVDNDGSDWAAEFQSANADVKAAAKFQKDSTHLPLKQEDSANIKIFQVPSTSDVELKSEPPFDPQPSLMNMPVKDGQKGLETIDDSFDWVPTVDKQRVSDNRDPLHDDTLGGDKSGDNWDEFGMFSGAKNNRGEDISSTMLEREDGGGLDMYDSWNDFTGSVGSGFKQLQNGIGDEFALSGHSGIEHHDVHSESRVDTTVNQDVSSGLSGTANNVDDSFDFWNDFKSSNVKDNNQQVTNNEVSGDTVYSADFGTLNVQNDAAGLGGGVKEQSVGSSKAVGDSSALWHDNSLDIWSDFGLSSTGGFDSKKITNETSTGELSDFSSLTITDPKFPQSEETKSAENHTSTQDDDDFGSWSDFKSSWKQPDSSFRDLDLNFSIQNNVSAERNAGNLPSVENNNLHSSQGDIGWSTSILDQPSHAIEAKPSDNKMTNENSDLFLGFHSSGQQSNLPDNTITIHGTAVQNGLSTSGNDEEIDDWTDFTSSSNEQVNNWLGSDVKTAVTHEPVINDPFNEWNMITNAPNKESGLVTAASENQPHLFSTNADSHVVGSNSPMQQDPFFGMLSDQNGFAQVASSQTEVPNLVRSEHQNVEVGDLGNGSESVFKETNDQKAIVESLISEMHDLSFMLESTLSIPKTDT